MKRPNLLEERKTTRNTSVQLGETSEEQMEKRPNKVFAKLKNGEDLRKIIFRCN